MNDETTRTDHETPGRTPPQPTPTPPPIELPPLPPLSGAVPKQLVATVCMETLVDGAHHALRRTREYLEMAATAASPAADRSAALTTAREQIAEARAYLSMLRYAQPSWFLSNLPPQSPSNPVGPDVAAMEEAERAYSTAAIHLNIEIVGARHVETIDTYKRHRGIE